MSWFLVQRLLIGPATNWRFQILLILSFWKNMTPFMSQKGIFLRFRRIFYEKMPFWLVKGVIFLQKLKICKIQERNFVAGPMKSLYTKNQLIPTICLWLLFFYSKKVVQKSQRKNRKKSANIYFMFSLGLNRVKGVFICTSYEPTIVNLQWKNRR